MALQSQSDRSLELGSPSYNYRPGSNRTSKAPLFVAGAVVIAAASVAIWYFATKPGTATPGANDSNKTLALGGSKGNDKPAAGIGTNKPESKPELTPSIKPESTPSPVTIALGSGQPLPGSGTQPSPTNPAPRPSATPGSTPAVPTNPPPSSTPGISPTGTPGTTPTGTPTQTPGPGDTGKPGPTDVTTPGGTPTGPASGPQTPTPPGPGTSIPATGSTGDILSLIADGDRKARSNDLVGALASYSKALASTKTARSDQETLRSKIATLNQDLIFSTKIYAGDPMVEEYTIEAGDGLQKIAKKRNLVTDYRLIERINKADSSKLKVGQKLKLVRGPFHAVVHKSDYRLDLFWGPPKSPEDWVFVKSVKVGLGEKTPVGEFTVKAGSKQINPPWTNPTTGEKFAGDNPKNPIGKHWIGIQGEGDASKYKGFGLHGTIEPDSIGQSKSMGCVRMLADDVALVYELMMDPMSVVRIEP